MRAIVVSLALDHRGQLVGFTLTEAAAAPVPRPVPRAVNRTLEAVTKAVRRAMRAAREAAHV